MFNVQGKNVVVVGGLNGVGLSLCKAILNKNANKLFIVDVTENTSFIQELRSRAQNTKIYYERIDYLHCQSGELQNIIQNIVMKMQYIDCFINALEVNIEKDLQRTMDINMKLYLNLTLFVRNVMDRNKGGRGGVVVNVLSNLGFQTLNNEYGSGYDCQQYLINKQMLLSLTKAFSDEVFFQQTGVLVMSVLPVINQKNITRNLDWAKHIGLQNLVIDMNLVGGQNTFYGNHDSFDFDLFEKNNKWTNEHYDYDCEDEFTGRHERYGKHHHDTDYYNHDSTQGYRLGNYSGNIRKSIDYLCYNIIRAIEHCQNGTVSIVGFGGVKKVQQLGYLSRL